MTFGALFFVVWALFTLALRGLLVRTAPQAGRRVHITLAGGVALALAFLVMRVVQDNAPGRAQVYAPPAHATLPPPQRVSADELARLPFTVVSDPGHTARAAFTDAAARRPGPRMALRLADETTRTVQRYLVLHGDTLRLIIDERRRSDGQGELYGLALADVQLAHCDREQRACAVVAPDAPVDTAGVYRILARFPDDTSFTVRF